MGKRSCQGIGKAMGAQAREAREGGGLGLGSKARAHRKTRCTVCYY